MPAIPTRPWSMVPSLSAACLLGLAAPASASRGAPRTMPGAAVGRDALVRELEHLTQGLLFLSEADFPLNVVIWRQPGVAPTARQLAALTGQPHPNLVQEMTVDQFFRNATTPRPWHDAVEQTVVRRYGGVVHFLKTRLTGARVFRFGRLTIHAYVVGTSPSGDWIGLTTTQIET